VGDSREGHVIELGLIDYGPGDLWHIRRTVAEVVARYRADRASDLALAVHEVAVNGLLHGSGRRRLEIRLEGRSLVFEVMDENGTENVPRVMSVPTTATAGRGLRLAERLSDGLDIEARGDLTRVRLFLNV